MPVSDKTPGRNELCPCGSGTKFKRCCGSGDAWVPGLGWVPGLERTRVTPGVMLRDAEKDPLLLNSAAWIAFCAAERAAEKGHNDVAVAGWEGVFRRTERHPWIDYIELADHIALAYVRMKSWDVALEWLEVELAIIREKPGAPNLWVCRRDMAGVLLRAGRRDEAAAIFSENRAATPDDIWLYNGAALAWLDAGNDPNEALSWIEKGITVAQQTGDPERMLGQLEDMRSEAMQGASVSDSGDANRDMAN